MRVLHPKCIMHPALSIHHHASLFADIASIILQRISFFITIETQLLGKTPLLGGFRLFTCADTSDHCDTGMLDRPSCQYTCPNISHDLCIVATSSSCECTWFPILGSPFLRFFIDFAISFSSGVEAAPWPLLQWGMYFYYMELETMSLVHCGKSNGR